MKKRILIVPLVAVIMVFTAVGLGYARSPYVPNYYSYDPEWKGDLPKFGGYVDAYLTYSQQYDGQYNDLDAKKVEFTLDRAELYLQHRATDWAAGCGVVTIATLACGRSWARVMATSPVPGGRSSSR